MKQNVSRGGGKAAKPKTGSNKPTQAQMIASLAAAKNKPAIKPTAAITAKGQKATGLAKSTVKGNRFSTTAKTTVKKPTDSFAGYGSPFAAMPQQVTKGQVGNALLAISMSPGSGQVTKYVASKAGSKVAAEAIKKLQRNLSSTPRMAKKILPDEIIRVASTPRMAKRILPDEIIRVASKKKK